MLLHPTAPGPKARDNESWRVACEYGPLATRRKRMAIACRCANCALGTWVDQRVRKLLDVGRAYAERTAPLAALMTALREAEKAVAGATRRSTTDVWSIFEGRRAGDAAGEARAARIATGAVRWALGTGGAVPLVPPKWGWAKAAFAQATTAPVCTPDWRTQDVLALARLAQAGEPNVMPILADALQDAGCADEHILGHCRDHHEGAHTANCWVPDLVLDTE